MPPIRRRSLQLSSLALVGAVVVLGTSLTASASLQHPTAASVIAAAKISMAKEKGVHVKVVNVVGKVESTLEGEIGSASGTETFTSGKANFTITVTPEYAYLSGSASGLTTLMGLTSAEQKKIGKDSMSMKKGTSEYTQFQHAMTTGAFSQLLPPAKGTTLLSRRDKATNGYQLTWTTKATSSAPKTTTVMTLSSGRATLLLKDKVTSPTSLSTMTFSKWGEAVRVAVPTSTITYAKVFSTK